MALDETQRAALNVILQACADECANSPLGNLLESHLKVVAAEALLRRGYSILESANMKGQGRVVAFQAGTLTSTLHPRPAIVAFPDSGKQRMSPDLRVWAPCRVVVELQVRSCFGSQSAISSDNLFDDLRRVGNNAVDAFVLAADRPLYDAARGVKEERRGRKAKHADLIPLLLPPSESLLEAETCRAWPSLKTVDDHFQVTGVRLNTAFGIQRCVVGIWRAA